MSANYDQLWKLLIDKKMKRTDLIHCAGISSNVLARLGKSQYVSLESLERICICLECQIGDVMSFQADTLDLVDNVEVEYAVCDKESD